jgi:hypothetical protein
MNCIRFLDREALWRYLQLLPAQAVWLQAQVICRTNWVALLAEWLEGHELVGVSE